MTIFDLVFLIGVVVALGAAIIAAVHALRGRGPRARRTLARLAAAVMLYIGTVLGVSLATPRRVLPQTERRCWDEWCLTVERVTRGESIGPTVSASPDDLFYVVDVRVASLAKRQRQRERGVVLYLLDASGHRYDPDLPGMRALATSGRGGVPIETELAPGESVLHRVAFRVPRNATGLGLVKEGPGPQALIIADDESLFHKRTVTRLDVIDSAR